MGDVVDDEKFGSTDTHTIPYTRILVKSVYRVVSLIHLAMHPIDRDPLAVLYTWSLRGHHLIPPSLHVPHWRIRGIVERAGNQP